MPLLKVETTAALTDEKREALLQSLSRAVARAIGKPEQYVMVMAGQVDILMSGKPGDAAFVDIRSIGGLNGDVNRKLSREICKLLRDALGIPPERVYLNFSDVDSSRWGWNESTFA